MDEYICKIATIEEMEQNWNYCSVTIDVKQK